MITIDTNPLLGLGFDFLVKGEEKHVFSAYCVCNKSWLINFHQFDTLRWVVSKKSFDTWYIVMYFN